jgi:lycopene cyclase domain-containing protein
MSLYFILLLASIAVPFLLSFDKKLQFYRHWKFVLPSIALVGVFYILADIYLTGLGVWGFNPRYLSGIYFWGLPLEEWLFFVVIPYASIFLHEAFILYFPGVKVGKKTSLLISWFFIVFFAVMIVVFADRIYTVYIFSLTIVALLFSLFDRKRLISHFYITFLLILIPFFMVNGILTGTLIEEEVVWYNNAENLGIRVLTIPIEDFAYGFSLILFNLQLIQALKTRFIKNK